MEKNDKNAASWAVLFDCDGVLVNSEEVAAQRDPEYLARNYGLHYTPAEYASFAVGHTYESFVARLRADHQRIHGKPLPDDFEDRLTKRYRELMTAHLRQIPEIAKLLRALQAARIPYGICTNAGLAGTEWKLRHVGLRHYFNHHVYSKDMVERPKPAPDVYLHGARQLGFPPARCFVVEDSVTGVTAGVAAGAVVIGYTGGGHRPEGYGTALRRAGAVYTTDSMNNVGTFILNRVRSPQQRFGPQP